MGYPRLLRGCITTPDKMPRRHGINIKGGTILKFILPFVFGALLVGVQLLFDSENWEHIYYLMFLYFIPPLGKETIIPSAIALGISPLRAALTFAAMDSITALFIIWNFSHINRIPGIGKLISRVIIKAYLTLKHYPWARRLSYISLFIFVFVPFQGSGGVSAAVLGKILALKSYWIWATITMSATFSSLIIAYSVKIVIFSIT